MVLSNSAVHNFLQFLMKMPEQALTLLEEVLPHILANGK